MALQVQFDAALIGANATLIDNSAGATAPTLVQCAFGADGGVVLNSPPTAGNTLVMVLSGYGAIAPSDWTVVKPSTVWTRRVRDGDGTSWPMITNFNGSFPGAFILLEFQGQVGTISVQTGINTLAVSGNTLTGINIAPANTFSLIFFQHWAQSPTFQSCVGATKLGQVDRSGIFEAFRITSSGTVTVTYAAATNIATETQVTIGGSDSIAKSGVESLSGASTTLSVRQCALRSYFEFTSDAAATGTHRFGVANRSASLNSILGTDANGIGYDQNGSVYLNNASVATLAGWSPGANIGVAVNTLFQKIWFRVNGGNWNNDVIANQNPETNTGGISISALGQTSLLPAVGLNNIGTVYLLGTPRLEYSAPSGYSVIDTLSATVNPTVNDFAINKWTMPSWTVLNRSTPSLVAKWDFPPPTVTTKSNPERYKYKIYQLGTQMTLGLANTAISGVVQENGTPVSGKLVALYDAKSMQLIGTYVSDATGSFTIPAMGRAKVFAVAIDSGYQAQIFDNLTPQ